MAILDSLGNEATVQASIAAVRRGEGTEHDHVLITGAALATLIVEMGLPVNTLYSPTFTQSAVGVARMISLGQKRGNQ